MAEADNTETDRPVNGNAGEPAASVMRVPLVKPAPRGYLRGCRSAAAYLSVDRKTFRSWRDDPQLPDHVRRLLLPRIIRGESYYRVASLDRFMDPVNNIPDEDLFFRGRN